MLNETERKILSLIRDCPRISRVEIVEKLKISKPIVSTVVKKFIGKGLLEETEDHKRPSKGLGRKRIALRFVPDQFNIIGVDIGGTKLEGIVGDLDGNVLYSVRGSTKNIKSERRLLQVIYKSIDELIKHAEKEVLGIGIGVPGTMNKEDMSVEYMPAFELRDIDLRTPISKKYGLPVFVENDVTLDIYAEQRIGIGRHSKNLLLVSIGTGIGLGLIINGKTYTGANGKAGELGEMIIDWEKDKKARTQSPFGPLELWISGNSLEKKFSSLGIKSVEEGFELLERDKRVEKIVREGVEHLGLAISNLIFILNPEIIIIKGGIGFNQFEKIARYMLPLVKRVVPPEMLNNVTFQRGKISKFGVAIGGLFYVEKEVLNL